MAKQRHQDTNTSSKSPLLVMSIGALIVAGLVAWALTRTVEAPMTTPATTGTAQFPTTTVATTPGSGPAISDTTGALATTNTGAPTTSMPSAPTNVPLTVPQQNAPIGDKSTVTRIAAEDLRERVNAGQVVVVDVRDANSYAAAHIPGALHLPYATVEANLASLPKGKDIVFYCT